jgi:hypothetical protein
MQLTKNLFPVDAVCNRYDKAGDNEAGDVHSGGIEPVSFMLSALRARANADGDSAGLSGDPKRTRCGSRSDSFAVLDRGSPDRSSCSWRSGKIVRTCRDW